MHPRGGLARSVGIIGDAGFVTPDRMVEDEHAVSACDIFQQLLGFSVIGLADFFFIVEIYRGALMVDKRKTLAVEREGPGIRTRIMNGDAVRFGDNVGFRDARRRIEGIDPRTLAQGRRR